MSLFKLLDLDKFKKFKWQLNYKLDFLIFFILFCGGSFLLEIIWAATTASKHTHRHKDGEHETIFFNQLRMSKGNNIIYAKSISTPETSRAFSQLVHLLTLIT